MSKPRAMYEAEIALINRMPGHKDCCILIGSDRFQVFRSEESLEWYTHLDREYPWPLEYRDEID